jgi:hypothetical protein
VKRVLIAVVGVLLVVVGALLLVLPGPGLLVVLAGLLVLATEFPGVQRHVEPVRERAMQAAEASVSSSLRLTGSILAGMFLIVAGVVWGVEKSLPVGGWGTGVSLILSGLILLTLLGWSYRRVRPRRP